MSDLAFRNIDADPSDPVETWPYEGVVAAIERGSLSDWHRMAMAIRRAPWGVAARSVEAYAKYGEEKAVSALLLEAVRRARVSAEQRERDDVATRVRLSISRSGLSARRFALEVGTSGSRLSTYGSGAVQPSAAMLLRIEAAADRLAVAPRVGDTNVPGCNA